MASANANPETSNLQPLLLAACATGAVVAALWKSKRRLWGVYSYMRRFVSGGYQRVAS